MVSLDMVFELLSDERRRYVLYYLKEQNRPVSVEELAETLADWEENAGTDRDGKHVEVKLQHKHLPKATEVE